MNGTGPASTLKNLHSPLTVFSSGYAVLPDLARDTVSMDTPMASATSFNVSSRPNSSSLAFHKSNSVLRIATLKTSNCVMVEPVKFSLDKNSKVWYLILTHTFDGKINQIQQSSPNRETKNPAQSHQQCGTVGNEPGFVFLNAPKASGHLLTGLTKQKAKVSEMANTNNNLTLPDSQAQPTTIEDSNTIIILSDGSFVIVPLGSDPDWLRRYHENLIYRAKANPRPKRKSRTSGKPKASVNYAAQVVRRFIPLTQNGQTTMLEVA